jgi:hypothetical protein
MGKERHEHEERLNAAHQGGGCRHRTSSFHLNSLESQNTQDFPVKIDSPAIENPLA